MAERDVRIAGCRQAAACAQLDYRDRPDLALIEIAPGSCVSVVTTSNLMAAAPVLQVRQNLAAAGEGTTAEKSYWIVNAGNANAATGRRGIEDVRRYCRELSALTGTSEQMILPFSTGIIGEYLNTDSLIAAMPGLFRGLKDNGWQDAARAIMTTDSHHKCVHRSAVLAGGRVSCTGIAKGAAMICPNMATMLCFVATDAKLDAATLNAMHRRVVDDTFNRISVDADTSTNDCFALAATGQGEWTASDAASIDSLEALLREVCDELAQAIIRDAEGASRLVRIEVSGGLSVQECRQVADALAHSVLVKTCLSAADPNWGRMLMALGNCGLDDLDVGRLSLSLGKIPVFVRGEPVADYTDSAGRRELDRKEQLIRLDLGRGSAEGYALTCDLTEDYVRMNSNYRT